MGGPGPGHGSAVLDASVCSAATHGHRVQHPDGYHYCTVPHSGEDAILFIGVAVVAACVLRGKLATTLLLGAGALLAGVVAAPDVTLGRLGNAVSWFLSIVPYELFFYIFLPPLLLDAGVRIDYFLFKRHVVQILTAAFLVVGFTCGALIPLLLYGLQLAPLGWQWYHVALLGSMLASTDAVAIVAVMKERGGPRRLRVLLEGESLLNDASSFTLFTIFLGYVVAGVGSPDHAAHSGAVVVGRVVSDTLKLGFGGVAVGLAFGWGAHLVLKFMRRHGAGIDQQVALTLALGYLSFYTANIFHLSGVVSVAVFGLYGAATSTWDMPPAAHPAFEAFWDSLSFTANAIVFFFTGVAVVNFLQRAAQRMNDADAAAGVAEGGAHRLWVGLWRFPIVYVLVFGLRFALLTAFRPLFRLEGSDLPLKDAVFATVAGLRGSVALILAQAVMTGDVGTELPPSEIRIRSEIVLWTALFVLCTLVVNAPLLPRVLRWTGLDAVPAPRRALRGKALTALDSHTDAAVAALRAQEDEMLAGVDWARVRDMVRVKGAPAFDTFEGPPLKTSSHRDADAPGRGMAAAGTDAWASVAAAAKSVITCGGRLTREARATASAAPADRSARSRGRSGLKSSRSMANLFLEDASKPVSRHNRVFGRAITLSSEENGTRAPSDDVEAGRPGGGDSARAEPSASDADAINWDEINQMTVDASSVPFLPMRHVAPGATADAAESPRAVGTMTDSETPSSLPTSSVAPGDVEMGSLPRSTTPVGGGSTLRSPRGPPPAPDPAMHPRLVKTEAGYLPDPALWKPSATESAATVASVTAAAARARASLTRPSISRLSRPSPLGSVVGGGSGNDRSAATTPRLDALWREQEATLGAALTSPTSSLTAARPAPRHRTVFEAFNIARPSEENAAVDAAPTQPTTRRGSAPLGGRRTPAADDSATLDSRRSSGGGSDHGADAARRALAAATAAATAPGSTWTAGMTRGVSPLAALRGAVGGASFGAAAVAALEAPTLAEADAAAAAAGVVPPSAARRGVAWDDAAVASRGSGASASGSDAPAPQLTSSDSMHAAAGRALKSALSRVASTTRPRAAATHLEELRVRVAAGLKRHFGAKRAAGLLSARALRVLDTACAEAIDAPNAPLAIWAAVQRDVTARITSRILARVALAARRAKAALAGPPGAKSPLASMRRILAWPLAKIARAVLRHLSHVMLVACEAAMEMMLALTFAPGAALTVVTEHADADPAAAASYAAAVAAVADECDAQLRQVWLFLHDREAEAPERFQAIQTYRATMAVMRRQQAFVKAMFESGAVDADERDALLTPLAAREHALERRGPFWRAPAPPDVLRELPFVRGRADVAAFFLARSSLRVHPSSTTVASSAQPGDPTAAGFVVVIAGLVRVCAGGRAGGRADVYLGCGGVTGLLSALTGVEWGAWAAVAEGNALGKGPLVLHVSQDAVDEVRERSAAGNPIFQQVEVDMFRMASLFIVEREKPRLMAFLRAALAARGAGAPPTDDDADPDAPDAATRAFRAFVRGLAAAELVELPAGGKLHVRAAAVLLRGRVSAALGSGDGGSRGVLGRRATTPPPGVEYAAPALLPLVPTAARAAAPAHARPPVRLTAGPEGASLMVVPSEGAAPVTAPSCVDLPGLAAAAAAANTPLPPRPGAAAGPRHRVTRAAPLDAPLASDLAHEPPRAAKKGGGEGGGR